MSSFTKALGLGFNTAGALFPKRTASALSDLFLTPFPRMGASTWPPELAAIATETSRPVAGHPLSSWKFGKGDRRLLLCHGWGGCAANWTAMIPALLEAGFEVHTFDGPGHGDGKLRPTNMLEFGEVFSQLDDDYGPFTAAIGHSFGGGALTLALGRGFEVERVVLIAPMIDSGAATDYFLDQLRIKPNIRSNVHDHLRARFAENIDGWDLAVYAKRHTTPALIIQDRGDTRVPYEITARVPENWKNSTLVSTEGLGHRRILKDQSVIETLTRFVDSGTKPA